MRKRVNQFLVLLLLSCLWVSFSSFISIKSGKPGTTDFLYESGEWEGKKGGSLSGESKVSGTLRFTNSGSYTGAFSDKKPTGQGTYTFANGECVSGLFTW